MRNILSTAVLAICLGLSVHSIAQTAKGKTGTFALTGATIETITKGVIQNGTVIISNGKITAVGTNVSVPAGAEVIDCKGKFIYPGMIDGGSILGLSEVGSDPRTNDYNEVGDVIPQVKALVAVNPNATAIPVTRVSGVTTSLVVPQGGLFSGTAALINLHGYNPDQMFAGFEAVVMNFPQTGRRGSFDRRSEDDIKKAADKSLAKINETWDKAMQYHKLDSATKGKVEYYPQLQALLPVVRGERTLLVDVNAANDIKAAIKWVQDRKIKKVIFSGVAEGWRVADELAKAKIPVIAGPVQSLPTRESDRYDRPYANPGLMHKAGVTVALQAGDRNMNYRNLPFHAGFAAAYGWSREEALKAVTIVPAQLFGVADKLGSIETGKSATLFVCDGDPFETKTQVSHVFIEGWQIPMVSRQTELYDEFLERSPGTKK
ncbi:MAG: amidohydrolase family protein [Cyclobacteriaceae bacterium]|jgi:imidazolonepropionase-like amidohydrolase|nr:amidohydrolase family protein [Cyclobacteriaceae bacterium]